MSFPKITFTKNWEDPRDFPTIETSESQVRADIQLLYDELAAVINGIADLLNGTTGSGSAASNIGIDPVFGLEGSDVQSALESAGAQIDALNQYVVTGGITKEEADALYEPLTSAAQAFHNAGFNTVTNSMVFTRKDGGTLSVAIPTGAVPVRMDLIKSGNTYILRITNSDGSTTQCDVGDLLNSDMPINGGTWG